MVKTKNYKFYLVHFVREKGVFDIAFRDWICYVEEKKTFFCKYHAGSDGRLAQGLMKEFKPAPEEWESYPVEIRGGADTWNLALERLAELNDDPYAFSTSDEGFVKKQIEELKKKLKFKKIDQNDDEIDDMFSQVVGGSLNDNDKSTGFEVSSDETNKENNVRKKKQCLKRNKTPELSSSETSPGAYQERRKMKKKRTGAMSSDGKRRMLSSSEMQKESELRSQKPQSLSQPSTSRTRTADETRFNADSSESSSPKRHKVPEKSTQKIVESLSTTPIVRSLDVRNSTISSTVPRAKSSLNFSDRMANSRKDSDQSDAVPQQLRQLTSALGQLQSQLVKLHEGQKEMKALLIANRNVAGEDRPLSLKLEDHYCEDIIKFREFNTKLGEEKDFRLKICVAMLSKLNFKKSLSKNIGYILKPLLPNDVLQRYVSQKKTKDKDLFRELPIWPCIIDALQREARNNKIREYKDEELVQGLGGTINNCRSWGREIRKGVEGNGQAPEEALLDNEGQE